MKTKNKLVTAKKEANMIATILVLLGIVVIGISMNLGGDGDQPQGQSPDLAATSSGGDGTGPRRG